MAFNLLLPIFLTTDFQNGWDDSFYNGCEEEATASVG